MHLPCLTHAPCRTLADFEDYAYKPQVQALLQNMLTELFAERPKDPVAYMIDWLNKHKQGAEAPTSS